MSKFKAELTVRRLLWQHTKTFLANQRRIRETVAPEANGSWIDLSNSHPTHVGCGWKADHAQLGVV